MTLYLTDGNDTLYLAEEVDPRHMPAAGPLYRLTPATTLAAGERYRYICEAGHTTVTTQPYYDVCTAVLPYDGTVPGLPCGAPTEYRVIPYDAAGVDILAATKASLAATAAWLAEHKESGTTQPPDRAGEADGPSAAAPRSAPSSEGAESVPRPASRPAPSGATSAGGEA